VVTPSAAEDEEDASVNEERALWQKRLARAEQTLSGYLESTRYPPESRPIEENPDQVEPHHVPEVSHPLAREDRKLTDAKVILRQDRHFVVGDEKVTFLVSCMNSAGPASCGVLSSVAQRHPAGGGAGVNVPFSNSGDGALVAVFQPSTQGFADYFGIVRLSLQLEVDGETGGASFDIQYTPSPPAVFTGRVREALESGSLNLYVEMEVEKPGQYVLAARADDASGKTFAYLSFNEELGKGRQEAKLQIFGKLVLDAGVQAPFRLHDVEGFLLKENAFPDRELMRMIEGTAHVTKSYASRDFSSSEWESEEKDRHVKEFQKDVDDAKKNLESAGR